MKSQFRLLINPFAESDLHSSIEFYELQKTGLGEDFIYEVETTLKRIESNPNQFYQVKRNFRKALLDKFPFGIFFYLKDDLITVFAIFHFSRNPKKLSTRIKK
jgi:plasmid stabilization system protein ParE